MSRILLLMVVFSFLPLAVANAASADDKPQGGPATRPAATQPAGKVAKTDEEWRKLLSPMQYRVLREKGTERAFTGEYWNNHAAGMYVCAGCGLELFASDTKFDSGCGWPSFFQSFRKENIVEQLDTSHGMTRTEILCARCGGHLGHVFNDGPRDKTGLRYCLNSAAMKFIPATQPPGDKK